MKRRTQTIYAIWNYSRTNTWEIYGYYLDKESAQVGVDEKFSNMESAEIREIEVVSYITDKPKFTTTEESLRTEMSFQEAVQMLNLKTNGGREG